MADKKLTDLTEDTSPTSDDIMLTTDIGTLASKKVTLANLPKGFAIGDISDVTITSIASGEILKWNGTVFINNTLAEAGILALAGGTMTGAIDMGANNLDNIKTFTREETAGEALVSGDLCRLNTSGKYVKADASAESTAIGDLLMCTETIASDAVGTFIDYGKFTTSGLTAGDTMYLSETTGAITATAPTTSTSIVRIIGYALSTTILVFKPDQSFVEVV